jgi:hypothetical protein
LTIPASLLQVLQSLASGTRIAHHMLLLLDANLLPQLLNRNMQVLILPPHFLVHPVRGMLLRHRWQSPLNLLLRQIISILRLIRSIDQITRHDVLIPFWTAPVLVVLKSLSTQIALHPALIIRIKHRQTPQFSVQSLLLGSPVRCLEIWIVLLDGVGHWQHLLQLVFPLLQLLRSDTRQEHPLAFQTRAQGFPVIIFTGFVPDPDRVMRFCP